MLNFNSGDTPDTGASDDNEDSTVDDLPDRVINGNIQYFFLILQLQNSSTFWCIRYV